MEACHAVTHGFAQIFPHAEIFMAVLIFIAGYTTIIAYLATGERAARYLFPKLGRGIYFACAVCAFIAFSLIDQCHAITIMSISGGMLMLTNLIGIWKLKDEIVFEVK